MQISSVPYLTLGLFITTSLLVGCNQATAPAKATETKSIQEIAKEAMNSKGKLSKEQVDALIRANAACRPGDKH